MAYYFDPSSYANTLYGSPPFGRRRPSPPPATYYPREASDPYVRALAEEQAARTALQDAIKREREARQRRTEEEAKARIRERMRREERERACQRPQTMYGDYYSDYGYGYGQPSPNYGYGDFGNIGGYGGMGYNDDYYPQYAAYHSPAPRREPVRKPEFLSAPRTTRSQSRSPRQKRQPPSPKSPSPDLGPKISIPISGPSSKPSKPLKPEAPIEEQNAAATKIQTVFRIHHALNSIKSAHERFETLMSSFNLPESLEFDLSYEPRSEERPKLTYSKTNAPVHGHEDALIKLLQTLDAIESHGDHTVRERRRELVREVEKELERVDAEIRRQYELVKLKIASEPQAGTEKKDEAMDVEPEAQPSVSSATEKAEVEGSAISEERMGENVPSGYATAAGPSDEVNAVSSAQPDAPVESTRPSDAMDVEPPSPALAPSAAQTSEPAAEPIVVEQPAAARHDDSSPESDIDAEMKTPPPSSIVFSHPEPAIRSPDSPEVGMKSSVHEMQVEPTHVEKSVEERPVSSPTRRKVTVEDAVGDDKEYVVL